MAKIEKLTSKQEKSLATFRDKWLAIGLSTEPADRPEAEKAIDLAYTCAGLEHPRIRVWLESPFAGCIGAAFLDELRKRGGTIIGPGVRDQVGDQVGDQVWDQVGAQVGDQVRDQVRDQVWDQVRDQVRGQVRDQVWDQVWDQ